MRTGTRFCEWLFRDFLRDVYKRQVDAITEKLYEAGYDVLSGPRITGDGYYESTVLGPEDNQIEITE